MTSPKNFNFELSNIDAELAKRRREWERKAQAMNDADLISGRRRFYQAMEKLIAKKNNHEPVDDELEAIGQQYAVLDDEIVWRDYQKRKAEKQLNAKIY